MSDFNKNINNQNQGNKEGFDFKLIVESIDDLILIIDENLKTIYINEDTTFSLVGRKKAEIMGKNPLKILHPDDAEKALEAVKLVFKNGYGINRVRIKHKDGHWVWFESKGRLIINDQGEKKVVIISRDITDRVNKDNLEKKFQEKLTQEVYLRTTELNQMVKLQEKLLDEIIKSSRFKSDFMSTMSHELRTPLNVIIGFTELLSETDYGDLNQDQISFIENIMSSAEHLLELINKIINISKIESGKVELELKKLQLLPMITEIVSSFKPLIDEKNLNFNLVSFDKNIEINADPIRFKQIINNLLSNALKYTKEGSITLEIIENNNNWMFNVIDTGIGIQKKNYDMVFQEFERIDSEYNRAIEGSGLGLPITKRLINLHGGQIYFKSEFQKGTTFTFTIPKL